MGKTLGYGEITVANMTEPFTVMLTNEAQQFATDSNRKVTSAQSYYTDIIVIRGSQERTDYTIGNITSGSGITVSKSSKRVTFSVSAGTTIGADTGVIEIPITLDGQTVKKQFSWSCGKQGPQGVKGNDGNSFAWNMLSETNCGKKHWGTESSGGKYSVEDFITEDNIDAVKLICTEAISTSNWSYVSFKDIKMLKQLKPSTKYTLSYDIKANRSGAISHSICKGDVSNFCTNTVVVNNIIGNETWQHISVVLTTNDLKTTPTNEILYLGRNALSNVGYSIIKNLKLVEGDIDTPWSPSQSDIEGKGVVETVQYYLATSQASGVTSSTSGWSTDITTQKLTADKKYLWNCYQTKYSDGTSEPISTPKVIGVYGDKGTSTKIIRTSYEYTQTNIDKFSTSGYSGVWGVNDATTGLKVGDSVLLKVKNTTKGSDCLIFANITAIPSNYSLTCTSYGVIDNGSDGQDGAGFHWNLLKYSGDLSKQVLGGTGTYTATVESIEDKTTPSGQAEKITYTVQGTGGKFIQTGKYIKEGNIKQGKTYTVSVWCKCSSIKSTGVINAEFLDNKTYVNPTLSTEWQQYVVTGVANKDVTSTSSASAISFYYSDNMSVGDIFYISSPKVEEGDKASPWCTTYEETLAKNLTITPSSQYFKSTDGGKTFAPNAITIKATIQGEINFGKWQYSIDGGVSFADIVSGQKGLTINNNVLTVSKDSSLYSDAVTMVTFRAVASDSSFYDTCSIAKIYDVSDIGDGRNLLWNSNFAKTDEAITGTTNSWGLHYRNSNLIPTIDTSTKHNGFNTLKTVSAANGDKNSSNDLEWFAWGISEKTSNNLHTLATNYTLSFYAKASVSTDFVVRWGYDAYDTDTTRTLTTDWQKYEIKLHQTTSTYSISIIFKLLTAGTVWFSEFKLEKGSSATGYSPAPEDVQTAILSTKSEISDVSLKVDKNKQAIEQRVEKTTYQQDLNLVKGDISKANEGLNKWRYEIYPKSLFDSTDQGKSTIDIFAKNKNLTPSRTVLFNDTDLSIQWNSAENYIGYALTFTKFSAAKSVAITFAHDDGAHIYLNGKLIGGSDAYSQTGESLTLGFVKGWNCIEVVVNDKNSYEGFTLGTTISAISECQLMNCYYGTPVARQSHITNQLVENTTNIDGISTKVSKVTSVIGDNGENFTSFKNDYSDFKQTMNGFKTTVGQTYVTKDDFNGLEIGGRNLLLYSQTIRAHKDYYDVGWLTDEVETFNGCPVWSVKNQWGKLGWSFKSHVIDRGLVKVGDTLTYSLYAKTNNASGKRIACSYRFKGNAQGYWFNDSAFNVDTSWARYSVTFTVTKDMLATDTYMNEIGFGETASMSGDDKVYYACPKLERGTKATDYTPAPEDNEINGQNLVSNLPSNWEQGGINGGQAVGSTYASIKSSTAYRIRIKDIFSVSGNITVSAGGTTTNSSKETLSFYGTLYDAKKGLLRETGWKSFPSTINCGDAKYMSIILRWGDGTKTQIAPSDISQICLKIERGTSATPFTLAPEDVNGKIVNVETIANQTAKKFEWIVKSGTSASNFEITDKFMNLVSTNINLDGIVSFMNTAKGDGRKNLYNLDYSSFENVASQEDAICYAKDNGVTSVGIDSSVSYDGDKSLKISYTTANLNSSTTPLYLGSSTNNYGCVKIQAGKQYILSCYVKSDSTTGMFMIDIQGHDTPDTKTNGLYLSNIDPRKLPGSSTGVNLSTDWQRAVCAIKVADNATGLYWSVVPLIWGKPSSSNVPQTFNVWVDCIMLEEVDSISNEPGTYILDKETIIDGGSVKADTITGNQILAGSITADKIATDAIKSHNYISSGGTQGSFLNLGDGSFTSPNLSWDSNGNLIAKKANLSGEITATEGTIGKYEITDQWLTTGSGSTCTGIGGNQAFWAGAEDSNSAPFRVGYDGKLTSSNADISGKITAIKGTIGKYEITDTYLKTGSGSTCSGFGSDYALWAGNDEAKYAPFRVEYNGTLNVEHIVVHGDQEDVYMKIGKDYLTIQDVNTSAHFGLDGFDFEWANSRITTGDQGIELYGDTPYIDFHYDNRYSDYTSRIIADSSGCLHITDSLVVDTDIHVNNGYIYNSTYGHYSWWNKSHCYISCNSANGTDNVYYYAGYHAFYVNADSKNGMMYINTNGVTSRVGFTKTSDERIKKNFESFDDNIIDAYMNIEPVKYQLKQSSNDKYHFGFKAQHVDKVFSDYGESYNESFDICTSRPIDSDKAKELYGVDGMTEEYGLRYDELIAPTTYMVQHIYKELEQTKQEKVDLEARLQAIEEKLGL